MICLQPDAGDVQGSRHRAGALREAAASQPQEVKLLPLRDRAVRQVDTRQMFSLCLPPSTHVMLTQDRAAGGGGEDGLHSLHREGAGGGRVEDKQRHPVQAAAPLQQR